MKPFKSMSNEFFFFWTVSNEFQSPEKENLKNKNPFKSIICKEVLLSCQSSMDFHASGMWVPAAQPPSKTGLGFLRFPCGSTYPWIFYHIYVTKYSWFSFDIYLPSSISSLFQLSVLDQLSALSLSLRWFSVYYSPTQK